MQPDLAREVREWRRKADIDLTAAEALLRGARIVPSVAAFLSQQAAEKMLKAYLTWRQTPFGPIHDLRRLCDLCAASDPAFDGLIDAARELTPYAVAVRYPGAGPDPDLDEAEAAFRHAGEVAAFVAARLPDA